MGWGQWMVPQLSDAEDLELRRAELSLEDAATSEPHALAALAASLLRQNSMQRLIIEQAAARIMALELQQELAERPKRRPARPWWAISWPRLW
jgi:hypothetical protein